MCVGPFHCFSHVVNPLFWVLHIFAFLCYILDNFFWSNLWFPILPSVVFNLLPNTSVGVLMLLNFPFLEVLFDSLRDLWGDFFFFYRFFFPADVCKLVVYVFHVGGIHKLYGAVSEACPGLLLLSAVHTGSHSCHLISLCGCWSLTVLLAVALKNITCGDDLRLGVNVLFPTWMLKFSGITSWGPFQTKFVVLFVLGVKYVWWQDCGHIF